MNEDNCVLDRHDLKNINVLITHYLQTVAKCYRKKSEKSLGITFKKIMKLNEMAKQAKDKINHNDYIRHDTAPF